MADQPALFELPPVTLAAAAPNPEFVQLAAELPASIRLGTMSWSYPGWEGLVYAERHSAKLLADRGLAAYAQHALLRAVEIDRSYYEPLPTAEYRRYAEQVGDDFRFLVKAHEECTVHRFPGHSRYGARAGAVNSRYLDAAYTADRVVGPMLEGLGRKAFALLFQFPPQELDERPEAFAEALFRFLSDLPPCTYAVELRNAQRFTSSYADALTAAGAIHCHNVWTHVPPLLQQARLLPPATRRPLLVRWLMRRGDDYAAANARSAPFGKLVSPDDENLAAVAKLVAAAERNGVPALVTLDNKAEGSAPQTAIRLARLLAARG